jgi:hypothetical protein
MKLKAVVFDQNNALSHSMETVDEAKASLS